MKVRKIIESADNLRSQKPKATSQQVTYSSPVTELRLQFYHLEKSTSHIVHKLSSNGWKLSLLLYLLELKCSLKSLGFEVLFCTTLTTQTYLAKQIAYCAVLLSGFFQSPKYERKNSSASASDQAFVVASTRARAIAVNFILFNYFIILILIKNFGLLRQFLSRLFLLITVQKNVIFFKL